MNNEKREYYKQHLEEFIKEIMGIELFPWQEYVLKEYIKDPSKKYFVRFGRTPAKRLFFKAVAKIEEELLTDKM